MLLGLLGSFVRAVRGRSLTFSVLFATGLIGGISLAGWMRTSLSSFDLWRPLVWVFPLIFFGWLARHERGLKLRPEFKRLCSFLLVFGSLSLSVLIWRYQAHLDARYPNPEPTRPHAVERMRGPRGK